MFTSPVLLSVDEYLHTGYTPDREYIDGQVVERNLGEKPHSKAQRGCVLYFGSKRKSHGFHCFPEQRIQVKPTRFRVPDVCVYVGSEPGEAVLRTPPFLAIEILSPEDRVGSFQERIDDYLNFGAANVWVIDPVRRRGWMHNQSGTTEAKDGVMRTAEPEVSAALAELLDG